MKISKIEFTSVKVPFVPLMDVLNRGENALASVPKVIIKVHTDEGLIGLGETARGVSPEQVGRFAAFLVGKDPFELNLQSLGFPQDMNFVFEHALYDIVGKALGLPVYKLLGGAYRHDIPVSAWSPYHGEGNPQKTAVIAKHAAEKGFTVIKLKARPWDIVETVEAIENAIGPGMGIVCDPNTAFRLPSVAVDLARKLEKRSIACFEDPIPKWNMDSYIMLRKKIDIPIALHVSGTDVIKAVKEETCDFINTGGTMHEFKKYAGIAEVAGIPVWHGSGNDLGIMETSFIHASASTENSTLTSDIFGEFCRVDDLLVEPIHINNGLAKVPQEPGLGIELDEKALSRYQLAKTKTVNNK